jgi:hypothetical protein
MMTIKIEGIEFHYKTVADMNRGIEENLASLRSKRLKTAAELKALKRQEHAFQKLIQTPRIATTEARKRSVAL